MKTLHTINISVFVRDPIMEMLSMEDIERWREESDYWKDWDDAKLTAHNQDCLRRREEGYIQVQARVEALEGPFDFSKAGLEAVPKGARTDWRTPWFKPADAAAQGDKLVEVLQKTLECLKGGGFLKLCEEEA